MWVPKAGWVRFRWSRAVPQGVKSYRVTMDRAGRWQVAFTAIPLPVPPPGTRENPGRNVRQKSELNRGILRSGWGLLVRRLEHKAPGRVEKVNAAFTSQRCSACGLVDARSRESQPRFAVHGLRLRLPR